MASLPDLPLYPDIGLDGYVVSVDALNKWAHELLVLKYAELDEEYGETYLVVRTWLNAYQARFPENNFDNAPLYLDVLVWLDGFVVYLEGIS